MTHLERLIAEYYDWKGFLVKQNIKVGRRGAGGWEMELDVVAYHPHEGRLLHVEASLDADPWAKREERYTKKFGIGEKYILNEVFTWLPSGTKIEREAIFPSAPQDRTHIAGARLRSIDGFMKQIRDEILACKVMAKEAIRLTKTNRKTIPISMGFPICAFERQWRLDKTSNRLVKGKNGTSRRRWKSGDLLGL